MGGIELAIGRHRRIGLDTSIFIYHLEASPRYVPVTEILFEILPAGKISAVTSVLTVMELTVRPLQLARSEVADEYEVLVATFPNLLLVNVDRAVARRAAELRARHRLRTADAVQVATALLNEATAFLTNDKDLRRIDELEVLLLDDFISV